MKEMAEQVGWGVTTSNFCRATESHCMFTSPLAKRGGPCCGVTLAERCPCAVLVAEA